jgi:hypothetical protein
MAMDGTYSLADIRAVTEGEDRDSAFGGNNALMWIVLIFLFFLAFSGGFGNGFGGNNGLSQVERDVLTGTASNAQAIYNTSCDTQKEVLESRYTTQLGFQNTQAQMASCCCDIKQAILNDGEQTRALITANTIQDLRDRLSVANTAITSQTLANDIISAVRPTPIPAYITCSPYTSAYYGLNGYNYSCGCGNV